MGTSAVAQTVFRTFAFSLPTMEPATLMHSFKRDYYYPLALFKLFTLHAVVICAQSRVINLHFLYDRHSCFP